MSKVAIGALPLAPKHHLLIHNLTPDPLTPSVSAFRNQVLTTKPSLQRRARLLEQESHFSFVSPLPLPFPYDITPPESTGVVHEKSNYIEQWLAAREAVQPAEQSPNDVTGHLRTYYAENRDQPRVLIGLAESALNDCLPRLDVGDAFKTLGNPAFVPSDEDINRETDDSTAAANARQQLVDVLSGHAVIMSSDMDNSLAFAPWSLRYSGHQFGNWAGQLGDGRAISILTTPHPSNPEETYELQLKGAGRTPFSRSADGLAVLRSSIREFLCSEAMQALQIPTSRALSLISLPSLPVLRERLEYSCVLTRIAPSFLRIGSFEALNPPTSLYFFGGGQQEADWDALRILGEWVSKRVLRLELGEGKAWAKELVMEVARRNAKMVAGWQAYGFMHGVINTDNVSVLGLTIDYGPYAFMDVFNPRHICNHSDAEGRYAYMYQPTMIVYALRALLSSLAPIIGAEIEAAGNAVPAGWADGASEHKLKEWAVRGSEAVKDEMERVTQDVTAQEYSRLMRKRLGLRLSIPDDASKLVHPLLTILEQHKLDFHSTFRHLTTFRPSLVSEPSHMNAFIDTLLRFTPDASTMDRERAVADWTGWLQKYAARIESEREAWDDAANVGAEREKEAKAVNPRFVLRQWVLEEVIKQVEADEQSGKRVLGKVLKMACNPFEPWGAEGDERPSGELDAEVREERRYCGMGARSMLGFQCSCSS